MERLLPLWTTRNKVWRREGLLEENRILNNKIIWMEAHKEEMLAYQDGWMTNIYLRALGRMKQETKRKLNRNYERAKKVYEMDRKQKRQGQQRIGEFFSKVHTGQRGDEEGSTDHTD